VPESQPSLIVLAGAGGAIALVALTVAVLAIRGCASDGSARAPRAPGVGANVARDGMQAPGTSELRALGCDPALVLDLYRLLGDASAVRPGEPRYIVTCDIPGAAAPTCERAAATYFAALGGSAGGNVNIRVARVGVSAPLCSRIYAPSGASL
jgi:hypothetical protein